MARRRAEMMADESSSDWPSLNVLYEEAKGRVAAQDAHSATLDTKANFALGSATLLTAGAAALRTAAQGAIGKTTPDWQLWGHAVSKVFVVNVVTLLTLLVYVIVVFCSYQAYRLRPFKTSPYVRRLVDEWRGKSAAETKAMLTESRASDLDHNETIINNKIKWTNYSLHALLAESAILFIIGVVQAFL